MTPEKVKCWKCGMTFDVGTPPANRGERLKCAERACDRPFWSTVDTAHAVVKVGVFPADADRYTPVHMPNR